MGVANKETEAPPLFVPYPPRPSRFTWQGFAMLGRRGASRERCLLPVRGAALHVPPHHDLYAPAVRRKTPGEDGGSGGNRCRLDRRLTRGYLVAHGAGRQIAPVRHQAGPARRGDEAL